MPYRQPRGGLNPGGAGMGWRLTRPEGGTAILVAGLFLALTLLLPPSPRPALAERSSRREGGDQGYFYARGFAPCIPGGCARAALTNHAIQANPRGAEPGRHTEKGWRLTRPTGAQWLWSPDFPALSMLSCPYPPDPLPRRGRGRPRFFMQGASPLASPGAEPGRR